MSLGTEIFNVACLTAIGALFQLLVAWRRCRTWIAYLLSLACFLAFYAWMTDKIPGSWRYADVAPWGTGFLVWLPSTAAGHLMAERFGLTRNSIGGKKDATSLPDALAVPAPPAGQ